MPAIICVNMHSVITESSVDNVCSSF